jgi:hypothetical protein
MERGWVGRLDGDRVVHLAAQTLQSFFTGGGSAREHAEYGLDGVVLLAPVLHPPAVRLFDDQDVFAFANPAAVVGPRAAVGRPPASNRLLQGGLSLLPRIAAVLGAEGAIGGFTALADWRDPSLSPPKDRDFALALGPVVVTPDELDPSELAAAVRVDGGEALRGRFGAFDWPAARDLAASGTTLRPGDLLAGPALRPVEIAAGEVELEVEGIGVLAATVTRA